MSERIFMVFDVESIGLHGEGFAAAWVVVSTQRDGRLDEGFVSCDPDLAAGTGTGHDWVKANVPTLETCYDSPRMVRDALWDVWATWHERGALLVADCGWPVEARFLARCVDDQPATRAWSGPYPLHDLASILLACGKDPLATRERLPDELPEHHPLMDARQSARVLLEACVAPAPPAPCPAPDPLASLPGALSSPVPPEGVTERATGAAWEAHMARVRERG